MCVEACPCDAIRMDTYVHPRIWGYSRVDFIETKEVLMERSRTLAQGGRDSLMIQMLESYKQAENQV
jgi:formate hydrogenlyase subunit 6/NADH:ubiquinone oxidoreductase subunit I